MARTHANPACRQVGRAIMASAAAVLVVALAGSAAIGAAVSIDQLITAPQSSQAPAASFQVAQAATPAEAGDATLELIRLAGEGDKDAAVALAKYYVSGDESDPETAAKYAMIAMADGGQKYSAPFLGNTRAWSRDFWRMVQLELATNGDYTSDIDGLPGPGTRRAIWAHAGIKAANATQGVRKAYRKKVRRGSNHN